jgi:hypothetical protein
LPPIFSRTPALAEPWIFLDYAVLTPTAPLSINLLPGTHNLWGPGGSEQFAFTVAADGSISYDPSLQGVFQGAGSNTLVVKGVSVTINVPGAVWVNVDYATYWPSGPLTVNLLPGSNFVQTTTGVPVIYFTVAADGTISYDASLDDIVSGAGTNTLTIS